MKRTWKTTYQPYGGKWHLKEVHYRVSLDATEPLVHTAAFFTTALDTANDRSLAYAERMQYGDVFLKNSVAFDSAFWRHYVPPLPDAPLQQALAAQAGAAPAAGAGASATTFERAQAAARPPARWRRCYDAFWRRLSLTYAVGMVPVTAGENAVSVAYAPGGPFAAQGSGAVPGRRASAFTSFGYQFEVVRGVFARYASLDVRGAYGQGRDGWQVGLGYQHNLSRQRRPVYLRASLSYTHLVLGRSLGAFDNPDRGVRLARTTLNARRLAWALQTRREAWQPQLGLAVELNHRYDVFLDAGYLLERSSRTELSVRETSGFFLTRSNAVQPLPATGAELRINDAPATEAPWQPARLLWQFGVARRFR